MENGEFLVQTRELRKLAVKQLFAYRATLDRIRDVVRDHDANRGWSSDIEAVASILAAHDAAMFTLGFDHDAN